MYRSRMRETVEEFVTKQRDWDAVYFTTDGTDRMDFDLVVFCLTANPPMPSLRRTCGCEGSWV